MSIRTLRVSEAVPNGEPARYRNSSGYVRLRWLTAPGEYVEVYEHRFVAGMPDEDLHVHHRNRIRDDNRPDNLLVLTAEEHARLHADEDREMFAERKAARNGFRSVAAQRKAERAASRRAAIHARSLRMRVMYEDGATTTEVARAFGVDASRVSVHLRRVGTTMRTRWTR